MVLVWRICVKCVCECGSIRCDDVVTCYDYYYYVTMRVVVCFRCHRVIQPEILIVESNTNFRNTAKVPLFSGTCGCLGRKIRETLTAKRQTSGKKSPKIPTSLSRQIGKRTNTNFSAIHTKKSKKTKCQPRITTLATKQPAHKKKSHPSILNPIPTSPHFSDSSPSLMVACPTIFMHENKSVRDRWTT